MIISKLVFERYEKLRNSGSINMKEVKNVCLMAEISREEYFEIIQHYCKYKEEYS